MTSCKSVERFIFFVIFSLGCYSSIKVHVIKKLFVKIIIKGSIRPDNGQRGTTGWIVISA
jgi:hypothetical protein